MATKVYQYTDDAGTPWGIQVEENVMSVYAVVQTHNGGAATAAAAPTAYANLAALILANGAVSAMLPGSIQPRGLNLNSAGFGNAFMPVLFNGVFAHDEGIYDGADFAMTVSQLGLTGDSPFPVDIAGVFVPAVSVIGYRGEARSSN